MIPKKIHYCWFGENPLPETAKKYMNTWKKYCPDYEIIEWNEKNFDITQNQYCQEAYKAKKWAFVSDYARLKVLYEYGGIYMDTDIEVIKPLDDLLKYNCFAGFEDENRIQTGIFGAEIKNEFIKILLNDYQNRHFICGKNKYDLSTNVQFITQKLKDNYNIQLNNIYQIFGNNYVLLPFDYLCCKNYLTEKICITKNSYTIHHFDGSWLNSYGKIKIFIQKIFCVILGIKRFNKLKDIIKNVKN